MTQRPWGREKAELVELNKRLEFYILKIRERDALESSLRNEIELLRHNGERELETQKSLFESEIRVLRAKRDEQGADLEAARQSIDWLSQENADLKRESDELRNNNLNLENKTSQLRGDLTAADKKVNALYRNVKDLEETIENFNPQKTSLETELEDLRKEKNKQVLQLQHQLQNSQEEILHLQEEVDRLNKSNKRASEMGRLSTSTHVPASTSSKEAFEAKYAKWVKEKEEGIADLKLQYDEKINGYRYQLESLGHDLEKERQLVEQISKELDDQKSVTNNIALERDTMKLRLVDIERVLENERKKIQ